MTMMVLATLSDMPVGMKVADITDIEEVCKIIERMMLEVDDDGWSAEVGLETRQLLHDREPIEFVHEDGSKIEVVYA